MAATAPEITVKLLPLASLFFIIDIPYLSQNWAKTMFQKVQGGLPVHLQWAAAPPVYLAMAFLLLHATSRISAFLIGVATYAVYNFTNLAVLAKYETAFAITDTTWGGILFAIVYELGTRLNLI